MKESFWYLATAYKNHPDGLHAAYELAVQQRGLLIKAGIAVFSPIIHSHPVAMMCDIDPLDYNIWLPCERPILDCACGLIILRAGGWENSYGIGKEREAFQNAGKQIIFMDPGIIPPILVKHAY